MWLSGICWELSEKSYEGFVKIFLKTTENALSAIKKIFGVILQENLAKIELFCGLRDTKR